MASLTHFVAGKKVCKETAAATSTTAEFNNVKEQKLRKTKKKKYICI